MRDRLKFRVWDGRKTKWMDSLISASNGSLASWLISCWTVYDEVHDQATFDNHRQDAYTVEQCTGLRDSKGVLIYEGDVVRLGRTEYSCTEVGNWWSENGTRLISEDPNTGQVGWHGIWWQAYCKANCANATVIGNIHENPELLEASDERPGQRGI